MGIFINYLTIEVSLSLSYIFILKMTRQDVQSKPAVFRDNQEKFKEHGIVVLGVSKDTILSHKNSLKNII